MTDERVEKIARVVDSDAWAYFDRDGGQHNATDLLRFEARKQRSVRKAREIIALFGEEGGRDYVPPDWSFLWFCSRHFHPSRRHTITDAELLSIVEYHPALRDLTHPRGEMK